MKLQAANRYITLRKALLTGTTVAFLVCYFMSCSAATQITNTNTTLNTSTHTTTTPQNNLEKKIADTDIIQASTANNTEAPDATSALEKTLPSKPIAQNNTRPEPLQTNPLPDHSKWNKLLQKHVNIKGEVAYKNLLQDKKELQNYVDHLTKNSPKKEWHINKKLAYYINLYNAATVLLIVNNYPTKSIKDLNNPWKKAWIKTGDGTVSLSDIEHKILRKMNEPRIHFAINCASYSCPKLRNTAFTSSKIESQLEEATRDFINDPTRNKISTAKLELSNIFKWYKKDFTTNGSLAHYINPYTPISVNDNTTIDYLKYNWSLNEAH